MSRNQKTYTQQIANLAPDNSESSLSLKKLEIQPGNIATEVVSELKHIFELTAACMDTLDKNLFYHATVWTEEDQLSSQQLIQLYNNLVKVQISGQSIKVECISQGTQF